MRFLSLPEVLQLHAQVVEQTGGSPGVRDMGGLESAMAQPLASFGGQDLYPTLAQKAAALGHSLVCNHPFVDGNKRVGHAAMETFLVLNGWELSVAVDEGEQVFLDLAAGKLDRTQFHEWVASRLVPFSTPAEE